MKNQLSQLKQIFTYYSPFWTEWVKCEYNGLSKQDIILINEYVKSNYALKVETTAEFNSQVEELKGVVSKLQEAFSDYLKFAFMHFQFSLIHLLNDGRFVNPLKLPIPLLPLNAKLIAILQQFNAPTLNELFNGEGNQTFEEMKNFREVLEFKTTLNYLNPAHILNSQPLNRTINWN